MATSWVIFRGVFPSYVIYEHAISSMETHPKSVIELVVGFFLSDTFKDEPISAGCAAYIGQDNIKGRLNVQLDLLSHTFILP
jgi:hypothetical protein